MTTWPVALLALENMGFTGRVVFTCTKWWWFKPSSENIIFSNGSSQKSKVSNSVADRYYIKYCLLKVFCYAQTKKIKICSGSRVVAGYCKVLS